MLPDNLYNAKMTEPRAFRQLSSIPVHRRLELIAEGLPIIHGHVSELISGIEKLEGSQLAVVEHLAEEEAAKALILLDIVRAGFKDQQAANRLTSAFYDHLARGIYVQMASMSPEHFGETRELVEMMRESHYNDGGDVELWEFRNQLSEQRESALYVDLVEWDDVGLAWTDPRSRNSHLFGPSTQASKLVIQLEHAGCFNQDALIEIQEVWRGVELTDATRRATLRDLNIEVFRRVVPEGVKIERETIDRWQFPLGSLELAMAKSDREALREKRESFNPDGYSISDEI